MQAPRPPPPPGPPQIAGHRSSTPNLPQTQVSLEQPPNKKGPPAPAKFFRRFRSVFRSFPVITSGCKMPVHLPGNRPHHDVHIHGGVRMTGTLFGHRKSRVNLAIQENPRCLPTIVLELSVHTGKLLQEMGQGLVRIALECEKNPAVKIKIADEPIWTMYCNGRKAGYAVKRNPTDDDLSVMRMLRPVSMGAGVLPVGDTTADAAEGEMAYLRAYFERVVGSKDSETYYMMSPDGNSGPELSIFFVRI